MIKSFAGMKKDAFFGGLMQDIAVFYILALCAVYLDFSKQYLEIMFEGFVLRNRWRRDNNR